MTRKMISAFLVLILCCSLALSVSAKERNINFVYDELGYLTPEESTALSDFAWEIYEQTGVGIFFSYLATEDIDTIDTRFFVKGITNYVLMVENETHWYMHLGGQGEVIDHEAEDELRAIYDATSTYVEGVMAFMEAAAEYFPPIAATTDATEEITYDADEYFLYDDADLLTDSEETALTEKLKEVSHTTNAQIVVATMASMDGGDIDSFVDYLYDTMGFGYGENHDGVLILVCMDPREYRILSNGFAGVAIDPDDISKICDEIVGNLSDGDYAGAFDEFVNECAYYLDGHINGFSFNAGKSLAISLIVGVAIGLSVVFVLKGQLKSVHSQSRAQEYVKTGSMHVNLSNDMFLYRNVTRTKKESSSSSGSSGGTARSKGGGSF